MFFLLGLSKLIVDLYNKINIIDFLSSHANDDVYDLIDISVVSKKRCLYAYSPIELGQNWSYYTLRQVYYTSRYFG